MNEFPPFYVDDTGSVRCGSGSGGVVENNPKKGAPVLLKAPLHGAVALNVSSKHAESV